MRHYQARLGQPLTSIQNQVEIECPGRPWRRPLTPFLTLNLQQRFK